MASDLNRVILIGRLTRDPELKYLQSGTAVARFSIANNRRYSTAGEKKEQVSFFECIAWSKLAEMLTEYCKKGQRIGIEGRLQQRSWDDQEGKKRSSVEIVVENVQFLSTTKEGTKESSSDQPDFASPSPSEDNAFTDDDIPF
jgi:single-strand DNA-binding protein